eukprot:1178066-Prorocentrum_minimum.AAC.2
MLRSVSARSTRARCSASVSSFIACSSATFTSICDQEGGRGGGVRPQGLKDWLHQPKSSSRDEPGHVPIQPPYAPPPFEGEGGVGPRGRQITVAVPELVPLGVPRLLHNHVPCAPAPPVFMSVWRLRNARHSPGPVSVTLL